MKRLSLVTLVCALAAWPALADVTMRSKVDYKLGSFLPPAAADMMKKQMSDQLEAGVLVRIKGGRSVTSSGPLTLISDQQKGTITLVDPKGKRYATSALADYADQLKAAMPAMPPEAKQMIEGMKIDVKTDKTGNTDVIKGVKAEELLVTMTIELPGPMAAMGSMKMDMRMWSAIASELDRMPALKEVAAYMKAQAAGTDAASAAAKMMAQFPGVGEKLKAPMEQMMKASSQAILRTQMKMIMPGSAKMMGAANPDEPLMDMTTDLIELSSDAIPDSVFEVPEGYQKTELAELVRLMVPRMPGQGQ
jgi:hypothetical protein